MARSRKVFRTPAARLDVLDIVDYIASDNAEAALRFLDAVRQGEEELLKFPGMGVRRHYRHPALADMRMRRVPGFSNHLIFYRPHPDGIEIIRVLHAARDLNAIFDEGSDAEN